MEPDKLITDARARIVGGEPPASVHNFLVSNGFSDMAADAIIDEFSLERGRALRKTGVRSILIGTVLIVVSVFMFWVLVRQPFPRTGGISTMDAIEGAAASLPLGLYGIWMLGKGISSVIRPQSGKKT
jgi:hypothetical protein